MQDCRSGSKVKVSVCATWVYRITDQLPRPAAMRYVPKLPYRHYILRLCCVTVERSLAIQTVAGSNLSASPLPGNSLGQAVHMHMLLLPSSIIWYRPVGGDALRLGNWESNGSLAPREWLKVTCGLTACTPRSAPGPTLANDYGELYLSVIPVAVFSMRLKCSGKSSSDVDVRMQLNVSIFSPINFTSLDIRRKKTCLRNPAIGTELHWPAHCGLGSFVYALEQTSAAKNFIGPILWGHSGPRCHALSLSLLLSSLSWTSMRRRRATVATPGEWQCKTVRSGEWAQHFSNAYCWSIYLFTYADGFMWTELYGRESGCSCALRRQTDRQTHSLQYSAVHMWAE